MINVALNAASRRYSNLKGDFCGEPVLFAITILSVVGVVFAAWSFEQRKNSVPWKEIARRVWQAIKVAAASALGLLMLVGLIGIGYERFFAENWIKQKFEYWSRGDYDHLVLNSLTLTNTSTSLEVRDMVITCRLLGNSGTTIDTVSATVYERIAPEQSVFVPRFDLGKMPEQATDITCKVSDATGRDPPKR